MKKFTSVLIAAFMVLALAGCNGNNSTDSISTEDTTSTAESAATSSTQGAQTGESDTNPGSSEPEPDTQESSSPMTTEPTTGAPETAEPETSIPETSAPETTAPETSAPETSKPEDTKPATTKPSTTKPATTKPAATKPASTKPTTTKPADTTKTPEPEEPAEVKISSPSELINSAWALFSEDEKFPVAGGDFSSGDVVDGAGPFSLDNPDELDRLTGFPASEVGKIDSAASMIHMMNTNTFSTGAYHVVEGTDTAALCKSIRDNIASIRWMCGFPDKFIVAEVGDYIVCAYGLEDLIDSYVKHMSEAYPFTTIVFEENIE